MPSTRSHSSAHRSPTASAPQFVLGDREFAAFRRLIYETAGISLTDAKRDLVTSRLARRVRRLKVGDFAGYLALLDRTPPGEGEWTAFINALTTNLTSFFRESHHFTVLTRFLRESRAPVRIWSAGCSTGEEPWSIAMTAREALGAEAERVRILATDLDTDVLATARAGIYPDDVTDKLDPVLRKKYFDVVPGSPRGDLSVRPDLRRLVRFAQVNLVRDDWGTDEPFDIIFCRNVVIYFDAPTRTELFGGFTGALREGGLLILGHSEGLGNAELPLAALGQTVWRKVDRIVPRSAPAHGTHTHDHGRPPVNAPHIGHKAPGHHAGHPHAAGGSERPTTRIVIGGICASATPRQVRTVLGSCIAACLYDPTARIGGMNHFMLPEGSSDAESASRFGVHAMELLINELMHLGADRRRIVAKVYGGASVLHLPNQKENVADRNIAFIRHFLRTEGIAVRAEQVGGKNALDVEFDTDTGDSRVRMLDNARALPSVAADEKAYADRIKLRSKKVETSNVELF